MSLSMEGADGPVDYSDYEYQQANFRLRVDQSAYGGTNIGLSVKDEIDVLAGQGGLANNEIAELVAMELTATIEVDLETGDQSFPSQLELRGSFGTDLDEQNFTDAGSVTKLEVGSNDAILLEDSGDGDATNLNAFETDTSTQSSPEVFQFFRASGAVSFIDSASGPGGASSTGQFYNFKNFRDLTGRGPVLDATDDLAVVQKIIADDLVADPSTNVEVHLIWDVAEDDDSGQRFSIPM